MADLDLVSGFLGERVDLAAELYHRDPAVGSSDLSLALTKSLYHFERKKAGAFEVETSESMAIGTLTHTALLEPERFRHDFVVAPKVDKRSKAGKAELEAWNADAKANGKTLVDPDDLAKAGRMADAIMGHVRARRAFELRPYLREPSYFWLDEESGIRCKCRPDHLAAGGALAVDLKTSRDVSPRSFAKSIVNFGYHRQRAHYIAGIEAVTRIRPEAWLFVVVENVEPHTVAVYELDEDFAELGEKSRRRALAKIRHGIDSRIWAVGDGKIVTLSRPGWASEED